MSTLFSKGCPAASKEAHREQTSANWNKVALKGDKAPPVSRAGLLLRTQT